MILCSLTKWVPPPVKMTSGYVKENINISRKRMDVAALDMLQFHWYTLFFTAIDFVIWYNSRVWKLQTVYLVSSSRNRKHFAIELLI